MVLADDQSLVGQEQEQEQACPVNDAGSKGGDPRSSQSASPFVAAGAGNCYFQGRDEAGNRRIKEQSRLASQSKGNLLAAGLAGKKK
ncbi:hypothetical protein AAL_07770 [Moelleriella libera RCEF 2490]|uniref:Uncharacterized protein n=1 Tax=Moelleriella libera RCEF 2490 TaxID=1081109 RepID=A0A167WZV8_9HYPO|nr:hypothetical protein AAL_07770 [Moelleriella libera RCEF 2490]